MRGNEGHADPKDRGDESTTARQNKRGLAVIPFAGRRLCGELQQRSMHVQIWHKLENNGQVQHGDEGFLHSSADKTHAKENRGKARMHDQRDVWRRVLLMQLAQTLRQVAIKACDKRDPRGTGKPSRGDPRNRNAQHEGKRRNDPGHMDLLSHVTDPLNDALQDADILFAHGQKQRQSCAEVQSSREKTSPSNGAGKRSPRILNLVTHDGTQFEPDQAEADDTERADQANVAGNAEIGCGHRGTKTKEDDKPEANERDRGNRGTHPTQIVDPPADAQAAYIQDNKKGEKHHRCAEGKPRIIGKRAGARARDVNGYAHEIEKDRGHVEDIIRPIAPSREEAVEVAEYLFGPEIYAALTRIAARQFDDGDALRPEKEKQRQEPKPDGYAAVRRDGRNYIEVDDRNDK